MKKVLKWSVLFTLILGIIWLFIMPDSLKMSPVMDITFLGSSISTGFIASRFWDLTTLVPISLLIFLLTKNDEDINPGIVIVSIMFVLILAFTFEETVRPLAVYAMCLFGVMVFVMALQGMDGTRWLQSIIQRLIVSVLVTLLATSLVFGIINGITVAIIFLAIYLAIWFILLLGFGLFKLITNIPKRSKQFLTWMNK